MASGEARLGSAVYNARDDAHRAEHWPGCETATRSGAREEDNELRGSSTTARLLKRLLGEVSRRHDASAGMR